jgi:DNA polymerase-3 subunit epsilon
VEAVPCFTQLQADVTELRLIGSSAPRYNRRSKFPERTQWIKITEEPFPRLSMVRVVRDDGATYFGPFTRRKSAEDVTLAIYDGFPIRQCTPRLSSSAAISACALAGMGRCAAPCDGTISRDGYREIVEAVRAVLSLDARPAVLSVQARLQRLIRQQRFEEAAIIRRRLEALTRTAARFHRIRSLAACAEIVAARKVELDWEIHVIRYGRLAGAGRATPREVPQAVARAVRLTSETVAKPPDPLPAAGIEETERIADWLEQPGIRLIDITGDWMWPLHAVLDHEALVQYALGDVADSTAGRPAARLG